MQVRILFIKTVFTTFTHIDSEGNSRNSWGSQKTQFSSSCGNELSPKSNGSTATPAGRCVKSHLC